MNKVLVEYFKAEEELDKIDDKISKECERIFSLLYRAENGNGKLVDFLDTWRAIGFNYYRHDSTLYLKFEGRYGCGCCPRDDESVKINPDLLFNEFLIESELKSLRWGRWVILSEKRKERKKENKRIKEAREKKDQEEYERLKEKFE